MFRFPEQINFRASKGTANALHEAAKAEGKRAADLVREAVAARLAKSARKTRAEHGKAA